MVGKQRVLTCRNETYYLSYKMAFNNLSSYWNSFQNQWSFDNIEDFDSFMSTADNKLGRWGIQPATSGVLGDAVARSKSLKYDAYDGASDIRNLPYD